jgi:hypothetical protein
VLSGLTLLFSAPRELRTDPQFSPLVLKKCIWVKTMRTASRKKDVGVGRHRGAANLQRSKALACACARVLRPKVCAFVTTL